MGNYLVTVVVEYEYKVEADTEEEAVEQAWNYEDYANSSTVNSIEVEDITEDEEDEN